MRLPTASLSTSTATAEPMADMNMKPLIDVMLVLIIMLIITIPQQNHVIDLNLSHGPQISAAAKSIIQIDVDFDGTILWNGMVVPSRAMLEQKLVAVAAAEGR